jgi:DNA polymerase III subunit alpha
VRGRVDHKERGETKLIVQEVEPFEPSAAELAAVPAVSGPVATRPSTSDPLLLKIDASRFADSLIVDLKGILEHFPGQTEVLLEMETSSGPRRLRFGPGCRVDTSRSLLAELNDLLGPDAMVA